MTDKPLVDELDKLDITPSADMPAPRRVPASSGKAKTAPPYKAGALVEPLTKVYAAFGLGLMPFAPTAAGAIAENGESCAEAWDEWAKTSPAVRRLLYPLLNVSGGAKVLAAHLPILLAVVMERAAGTNFADQVERYLSQFAPQEPDTE